MFEDTASALFGGVEGLQVTGVEAAPGGGIEVWAVTNCKTAAACPECDPRILTVTMRWLKRRQLPMKMYYTILVRYKHCLLHRVSMSARRGRFRWIRPRWTRC